MNNMIKGYENVLQRQCLLRSRFLVFCSKSFRLARVTGRFEAACSQAAHEGGTTNGIALRPSRTEGFFVKLSGVRRSVLTADTCRYGDYHDRHVATAAQ